MKNPLPICAATSQRKCHLLTTIALTGDIQSSAVCPECPALALVQWLQSQKGLAPLRAANLWPVTVTFQRLLDMVGHSCRSDAIFDVRSAMTSALQNLARPRPRSFVLP